MTSEPSPGMQMFVAVGLFILAWRLLPGADWHPTSKLMAGLPALMGAALMIGAVRRSPRQAAPWWQGLIGRGIAVGIAWGLIIAAAAIYGTPHLLYQYPPREAPGTCIYLGWKGVLRVKRSDWRNEPCPIVLLA